MEWPNRGCRSSRGGAHGRRTCPGRATRRLSRHHAEPAAATQRGQRGDAAGAQARAGRGRRGLRLPRALADRRRPRLLRGAGFARADDRRWQDNRAREHARHLLQPARAQAAHVAVPGGCRRQRRRGRRRRQYRARLRHRAGGALGELRAGLRQDRPHPRLRGHLVPAAAGRPRSRPRACAYGRAALRGQGRSLGPHLENVRRPRPDGAGAPDLRPVHRGAAFTGRRAP